MVTAEPEDFRYLDECQRDVEERRRGLRKPFAMTALSGVVTLSTVHMNNLTGRSNEDYNQVALSIIAIGSYAVVKSAPRTLSAARELLEAMVKHDRAAENCKPYFDEDDYEELGY